MAGLSLDSIRVATPCHADWNDMAGDERVRFCRECRRHVYNLSEMSRSEAEALVRSVEGRTCVRYFLREDGTVLTRDCPVGLRAWRRRLVLGCTAAAILVVSLAGLALGLSVRQTDAAPPDRAGLLERIWNALFPRPAAPPPPVVMGDICRDQVPPVPEIVVPEAPPILVLPEEK